MQISVPEQVKFLRTFYRRALPVNQRYQDVVRAGLEQRVGTVENALGVHPLKGDWRRATLNSKTGATTTDRYRVSWLVGSLRANGRDYVFASAVWRSDGQATTSTPRTSPPRRSSTPACYPGPVGLDMMRA